MDSPNWQPQIRQLTEIVGYQYSVVQQHPTGNGRDLFQLVKQSVGCPALEAAVAMKHFIAHGYLNGVIEEVWINGVLGIATPLGHSDLKEWLGHYSHVVKMNRIRQPTSPYYETLFTKDGLVEKLMRSAFLSQKLENLDNLQDFAARFIRHGVQHGYLVKTLDNYKGKEC